MLNNFLGSFGLPKITEFRVKFVKVLLKVFFDFNGIMHFQLLPYGRPVNKKYYLEVIHHLREASCETRRIVAKSVVEK